MLTTIMLAVAWSETIALVVAAIAGLVLLYVLQALKDREPTEAWWEPFCEAAVHYVSKNVVETASNLAKQQAAINQFSKLFLYATGQRPNESIVKKAVKGIEVAYQIFKMNSEGNVPVHADGLVDVDEDGVVKRVADDEG